jgi:hypothetical protein
MTQEELIRSFHCQWDSFPGLVRLIRRDRTVLAVNRAGEEGGARCGLRCCDQGVPGQHIGCMADRALDVSLEQYLTDRVFAGKLGDCLDPKPEDVDSFNAFIGRYREAIDVERAAVAHIR